MKYQIFKEQGKECRDRTFYVVYRDDKWVSSYLEYSAAMAYVDRQLTPVEPVAPELLYEVTV